MDKIIEENNCILVRFSLPCFSTLVYFLVVGENQCCGIEEKDSVKLKFYLNTNMSEDYAFGRSDTAEIPFTKEAVTKYAKAYIARRGQELYAEVVRLASTKKPSVTHRFYCNKYYDTDEMTVSIPYRIIGRDLCKSLELWTSDSMRVRLDKENENLEIIQTLRTADMDDDYYLLDVNEDADLIANNGGRNYDAINEYLQNAELELPF